MTTNSSKESVNDEFLAWFRSNGGSVHPAVGLTKFPSMGQGAVVLQDIQKETVLFTLPRSLTLSTRTSSLPSKFGVQEWKKYQLHKGWVGLILCMLWEESAVTDGKWRGYLSSLPETFQTPMFWNDVDLQELTGTSIFDKIGKTQAEDDYHDKIIPAIKTRPDLFPPSLESHYTLHRYHIMGSRILSRSFRVEKWTGDDAKEVGVDSHVHAQDAQSSNGMDVDGAELPSDQEVPEENVGEEYESDQEDEGDPADVAMVPLADVLNARYRSENAKLCYESEDLQMITTRDIQAGEQILNTYGDPPNSDLLRRHGHIDWIPMEGGLEGNPADILEIRADIVVDVLRSQTGARDEDPSLERIEWWLDEGGDDIFTLETDLTLPDGLVSLVRLLTMPSVEWREARDKGKVPKPKLSPRILSVAGMVLENRLAMYNTTSEEDEALLSTPNVLSSNKRMAVIVRLGEKRILKGALDGIRAKEVAACGGGGKNKRKDRAGSDVPEFGKKARR